MSEIRERTEPDGSRSIMFRTTILVWGPLLISLIVSVVGVLVVTCGNH
jgi:hypothetical protein